MTDMFLLKEKSEHRDRHGQRNDNMKTHGEDGHMPGMNDASAIQGLLTDTRTT